ncbi:MAG: GDSL-type esterase/lipase family protein [Bacillus sp. (in: Bacteria)]|nr:GDSL-type esterase/lipase family protein [Bacillus sp. (in: firmicutes)]MCM1426671.1 GDSL-type esterase/lipase family protein [Eubacterium sp.]
MYKQNYYFSSDSAFCKADDAQNTVHVKAKDLYTDKRGYGFITQQNMESQPLLMFPECNGGFMPVPWYRVLDLDKVDKRRQIPLRFKCAVPEEGSYRITVTLRSKEDLSDIRIFTGRRCLAAYIEKLPAGETFCQDMYVEVCGIIPRGQEKPCENRCIELSVTASGALAADGVTVDEAATDGAMASGAATDAATAEMAIANTASIKIEIEEIRCPVLYIAGDSTVTDQSAEYPYAPQTSYAGWGQMLPYFIKGVLTVSNHSHSGLTTESFRSEGHADIPMSRCKAGDYMLFQFGHNDQKLMHLKADEGYSANLERYITECRKKGVYPILVTPVARNTWRGSDGTYNDLLKDYADACLELGQRLAVPVLDLHRFSMEFVTGLEKENAKKYFFPSDYTHHNDFGAQRMAAIICEQIRQTCRDAGTGYAWLAAQMDEQPRLWDEPEPMEPMQKPEDFSLEDAPEEFAEPDRPSDVLLRAEALDMVIRRAGFFMTNVYNDYFTDIVGHEWYAGIIECGLSNGIINAADYPDKKFEPQEPVTLLDFIRFLMMAYKSRKTLPGAQPCPYDGVVDKPLQPLVSAAYQLDILAQDGTDALNGSIDRHQGAALCRKLKIM